MKLKNHNYNVIIGNDNANYNTVEVCRITSNNLESYCEEKLTTDHVNNQAGENLLKINDVKDTTTESI